MSRRDGILAIDVGLTNVKAIVFDVDGAILARAAVPYPTLRPGPDAVEQNPQAWLVALVDAVSRLPEPAREGLAGIGVTGHMHALVPVGADMLPVGLALVLGDRRAASDALEITALAGATEVYEATGAELDASMPVAKARFLRYHQPDRWVQIRHLLGCKDYVRLWLTGEIATDPIDACATGIYDIRSGRWSDTIPEAAGIDAATLPPVRSPWAVAGRLQVDPAARLGLKPGTPVAINSGDDVEVIGLGLLEPGTAAEHIGTTGSMMAVTDRPVVDPRRALELYPHVLPGRWVVGGSSTTAGAALAWAASLLGYRSVDHALDALDVRPLAGVAFLTSLAGERFPVRAPDARGAWTGLPTEFSRDELMRSTFEGVARALGDVLQQLDERIGTRHVVSVAMGGDPRWLQLRSSTYGRVLEISRTTDPTALGCAILTAVACGLYPDVHHAASSMTGLSGAIEPGSIGSPGATDPEMLLRPIWSAVAPAGRAAASIGRHDLAHAPAADGIRS